MDRNLQRLNSLSEEEATGQLLKCCGSESWAASLAARRPFRSEDELMAAADEIWLALKREDWLEAFSRHPKIGEKRAANTGPEEARKWSEQEQAATRRASPEMLSELAEANLAYEAKFGFIFIVCATGKSTEEMLALLRARLPNDPDTELRVAAGEQSKITRLRLRKLLEEG